MRKCKAGSTSYDEKIILQEILAYSDSYSGISFFTADLAEYDIIKADFSRALENFAAATGGSCIYES